MRASHGSPVGDSPYPQPHGQFSSTWRMCGAARKTLDRFANTLYTTGECAGRERGMPADAADWGGFQGTASRRRCVGGARRQCLNPPQSCRAAPGGPIEAETGAKPRVVARVCTCILRLGRDSTHLFVVSGEGGVCLEAFSISRFPVRHDPPATPHRFPRPDSRRSAAAAFGSVLPFIGSTPSSRRHNGI
jgi:hypothetical protein